MLSNKNIIVTGCLQGIGKETVSVFAQNGANVFACAYKKDEEFDNYCYDLSVKNDVSVIPIYFDMFDDIAIKNAVKIIKKQQMEIHGLINVAGINRDALFNMITYKDMIDTFQVNVFSQIVFSQYVVKLMQKNNTFGSIVFTSSVTAIDGNVGQVTYGASKAALIGAMKSMALELGKFGIRVNAVAPGVIKSPMTDKLENEIIEEKIKTMDIPRIGRASEVSNVYMYLVSDLSKHVSGQTIRVDGGIR